jgi:cobalt/nickel transport system permease protein
MHIPDGFLSTPVWAGLAAVSAPSVGVLAHRAKSRLDESRIPLMGVLGAFVFAAQLVNFPVGAGASGHLLGSALLAITLGPASAALVMTSILAIQALIFQDGGLLALGANVMNMAIAGVLAAYLPYRLLAGTRARAVGIFAGAFLSVFVASSLALSELAISGVPLPPKALGFALGVFAVTGLVEGAITLAVVEGLTRINPGFLSARHAAARPILGVLAIASIFLAACGFLVASALPDGLERTAAILGLEGRAIALFQSPLAGYEAWSAGAPWFRRATAALIGLAIAFLTCFALGRRITLWRGR